MALTAIPNTPAIDLFPTAPVSQPSPLLNAQYVACDPLNGNYFTATNRDLVTFICLPASSAAAWSTTVTYTQGQVVNGGSPAGTYIALANPSPNLNQSPGTSPTFWALYASSTLSITSAPDSCTGRTANVVSYPLPVFDSTQQSVEFLVLPSSVFTQANGQVQFQASSNLVYVYVRNL
jgi:hypothetical protein